MWKLFLLTFLCLFLKASCNDDSSGNQVVAAAQADDSSGNEVAAAAQAVISSNSAPGSNDDENYSDEDYDNDCNVEERDDDYNCTSAMPSVQLAIIKINFMRLNYSLYNNFVNNNNNCNSNYTQGEEGINGSPIATWYDFATIALYTSGETQYNIFKFLGIKNEDECRCVMKTMSRLNAPLFKGLYQFVGIIGADNKNKFSDIFKMDVMEYDNGKAINSDFSKPQKSARKANKYGETKTGKVNDVISKEDASTVYNQNQIYVNIDRLILTPIYKMSFNVKNKTKGIYYGMNGPIVAAYYGQKVILNTTESTIIGGRIISIPLMTNNTNLVIIFPNNKCRIRSIVAKLLSKPQIFLDEMKCLSEKTVYFTVPVYKSTTSVVNVMPSFQSLGGVNRVYNVSEAGIVDTCGRPQNTSVTYMYEKSTIIVNPIGKNPYKNASADDCCECGDPINVYINYPAIFLYMVNGIIIFYDLGTVENVEPFANECIEY